MALKIPPPPLLTGPQWQAFNRWLIELQSVLSNTGGIDPTQVVGLVALEAQVATNTTDIATIETELGGQGGSLAALTANVATNTASIATLFSDVTTLQSNPVVRNGVGGPAGGLGNINDWYADTANAKIYVKTAVGTWTVVSAS